MVEYSLAKAEVEGSNPFFRLGFSLPCFLLQKSIFFVALRPARVGADTRSAVANTPPTALANYNHLS